MNSFSIALISRNAGKEKGDRGKDALPHLRIKAGTIKGFIARARTALYTNP